MASPYQAAYVAAKHGVLGLVKTLALEGADQGIMATAVCPAFVRTPLIEAQIADQAKLHGLSEERVLEDVMLAAHAVKRLIEPEEVAETVAFCSVRAAGRSLARPSRWTSAGPLAEHHVQRLLLRPRAPAKSRVKRESPRPGRDAT